MKPADLALTEEARRGFYPTPPALAEKMLEGVEWNGVRSVLEPSAGKGDLIKAFLDKAPAHICTGRELHIDCVEIDPHLRQILKYEFSEEALDPIRAEYGRLDDMRYDDRSQEENDRLWDLRNRIAFYESTLVRVVHDDFLTYHTYTAYELCLMNPPFSNGDIHLLRAMEVMKGGGGQIICLLNAETLRNPCTVSRRILAQKLEDLGAGIEYVEGAFRDAERKTDVSVAIVRVAMPQPERRSEFYERMKTAADRRIETDPELKALVTGNYLEQAVQMYRVEVDATVKLIEEYFALRPYMADALTENGGSGDPILSLVVRHDSTYGGFSYTSYMRYVRLKYWRALLRNKKFVGKLTSDLQKRYQSEVDKMADYEFSMFNIQQVYLEMQEAMSKGIEEAILDLFDTLTVKYAHWHECKTTVWLYNGWKTNKAHKIGKKVILPENVEKSYYVASEHWVERREAFCVLSDIEKALDYLSAQPINEGYSLDSRLQWAEREHQSRNIELKYFKVDFFKKGTMHIKFLPETMPIVERLNIFGSQHHGWLPPNYGKSTYADMSGEEKAVVDAFHGDGGAGSGESAYAEVMRNAAFYLAAPTKKLPELMAPEEE